MFSFSLIFTTQLCQHLLRYYRESAWNVTKPVSIEIIYAAWKQPERAKWLSVMMPVIIGNDACHERLTVKQQSRRHTWQYHVKSSSVTNQEKNISLLISERVSLQLFVIPFSCIAGASRWRHRTRGTECHSLCHYRRLTGLCLRSLVGRSVAMSLSGLFHDRGRDRKTDRLCQLSERISK